MVVTFRAYAWTDEQLKNYKALKQKELFELLGDISTSVQQAMESLGEELFRYLEEAKGNQAEEKKEEKKVDHKTFAEKFFGDFYTPQSKKGKKGPSGKELRLLEEKIKEDVEKTKRPTIFHT